MKSFRKPLHHSIIFWGSLIYWIGTIALGSLLFGTVSTENKTALGIVVVLVAIFLISAIGHPFYLNGILLHDDRLELRNPLIGAINRTIAYQQIEHIVLRQSGPSCILIRITTTDGLTHRRMLGLVRQAQLSDLHHELLARGLNCTVRS